MLVAQTNNWILNFRRQQNYLETLSFLCASTKIGATPISSQDGRCRYDLSSRVTEPVVAIVIELLIALVLGELNLCFPFPPESLPCSRCLHPENPLEVVGSRKSEEPHTAVQIHQDLPGYRCSVLN